jgi:hypothetical protein
MLPPSSFQVRRRAAPDSAAGITGQPGPVADKRQPYMTVPSGTWPLHLNGRLRLNRRAAIAASENDDDESDTNALAPTMAACRHFALLYCLHSLKDPKFQPASLLTPSLIGQADPAWLDERDLQIARYASHVHLLPSGRFGEFLSMTFRDMLEEALESSEPTGLHWRIYYATTIHHAMGLRLKLQPAANGKWEFVVSVYDPNTTNLQVSSRTQRCDDFAEHARDHHFLSFLLQRGCSDEDRAVVMSYFPARDEAQHLQLFEVNDLQTRRKAPRSLSTDWCEHPRIGLIYGLCAEMDNQVSLRLRQLLPDDDSRVQVESLQAWPHVDSSLLRYAMHETDTRPLATWERVWQRQPLDVRIDLLKGSSRHGNHVLEDADMLSQHALMSWHRMAASLPNEALRRVLADHAPQQDSPLIFGLSQRFSLLIDLLIQLIDQACQDAPECAASLLNAHDRQGLSAMEVAIRCADEQTLGLWVARVMKLPAAQALPTLAGAHRNGHPLWARLIKRRDLPGIQLLAEVYTHWLPDTAALAPYLDCPPDSSIGEHLARTARAQPDLFAACVEAIGGFLSAATRQWLQALLTQLRSQPDHPVQ